MEKVQRTLLCECPVCREAQARPSYLCGLDGVGRYLSCECRMRNSKKEITRKVPNAGDLLGAAVLPGPLICE